MSKLVWNNQEINQRDDGYVNVGQMCAANGKDFFDWKRLKTSKDYVEALSSDTGIPGSELLRTQHGGDSKNQGTYVHPLIALEVARWISPQFSIWCNTHIKTLIETGTTSIVPQTYLEALEAAVVSEKARLIAEAEAKLLQEQVESLSETVDELFEYSSIIRVAKFNNCSEKNFKWQRLKAISNKMEVEVKRVPCPRFEYKNLYLHDVWRYCYPNIQLPETTTIKIIPN